MNWYKIVDRIVVFWLPILVLFVLCTSIVYARPVAKVQQDGITITLTDEPCKLPVVSNLPYRLTWEEGGKKFEGCFTVQQGIVVAYFSGDKTVVILPGHAFAPVTES